MRKIIVSSFLSLDGVMQAPGGPEEDSSDGFEFGGWTAPFFYEADAAAGEMMEQQLKPSELLLGRKTYDIFAAYWPQHGDFWPGVNEVRKYVMSKSGSHWQWNNSVFLNSVDELKKLKNTEGSDLQVHGSGDLVQTLLKHELVDELWLKIFPVTLGKGKRLFGEGTQPSSFTLTESLVVSNGVIFANYKKAGPVRTGTIGT
ncbi:dihydrofolate reductase family protein [Lacibacter sp. MH-610]|uniref:dihydrofolate reductase family protein n=1 Tax=Lacibacter sp. MH-610 TaxID=3020883 RepID=UPI0038919CDC